MTGKGPLNTSGFPLSLEGYGRALGELIAATSARDARGLELPLEDAVDRSLAMIAACRGSRRKCMLVGNGGSAAVVAHAQNDLCKADLVRAMVFTEQPLLTALANDKGYAAVYEDPIRLWAESGDVLIAISSSGESANILRAVAAARESGCGAITLSGFDYGNALSGRGDINFHVASHSYGFVETAHAAILHYFTDRLLGELQQPDRARRS